jgi:hypothetical protein
MAEIPEDDTLLIHCCENLKSIMMKSLLVPWPETVILDGTWFPWLLSVTSILHGLSCAHSHLHSAQSVHKMNGSFCWIKEIAVSGSHCNETALGPGEECAQVMGVQGYYTAHFASVKRPCLPK